jgi:hypothetical protein
LPAGQRPATVAFSQTLRETNPVGHPACTGQAIITDHSAAAQPSSAVATGNLPDRTHWLMCPAHVKALLRKQVTTKVHRIHAMRTLPGGANGFPNFIVLFREIAQTACNRKRQPFNAAPFKNITWFWMQCLAALCTQLIIAWLTPPSPL